MAELLMNIPDPRADLNTTGDVIDKLDELRWFLGALEMMEAGRSRVALSEEIMSGSMTTIVTEAQRSFEETYAVMMRVHDAAPPASLQRAARGR